MPVPLSQRQGNTGGIGLKWDADPVPKGGTFSGEREVMDEGFYFCVDC